jgi:hypothetical protein
MVGLSAGQEGRGAKQRWRINKKELAEASSFTFGFRDGV